MAAAATSAAAGEIRHRTVETNGIQLHVAESGPVGSASPAVLLIHGFPELWYSWRHQMSSLAARGFRCLAPDLRGYGGSAAPAEPSSYSVMHVVGDLVGLISALGLEQVFVVGHDWGAIIAWNLCLLRPDLVKALVAMSVVYNSRNPARKPMDTFATLFGEDHYICRFQKPGEAETELARIGAKSAIQKFYGYRKPAPFMFPKDKGFDEVLETVDIPWLTEEDLDYFASNFEKSGFTGGLNYYRCLNLSWELTAPWTGAQIKVPTKFIIGDLDLTYHTPGVQDYIHKGGFKLAVPLLEDVVVMEGVGHFINQEKPAEVSDHIYEFFQKF